MKTLAQYINESVENEAFDVEKFKEYFKVLNIKLNNQNIIPEYKGKFDYYNVLVPDIKGKSYPSEFFTICAADTFLEVSWGNYSTALQYIVDYMRPCLDAQFAHGRLFSDCYFFNQTICRVIWDSVGGSGIAKLISSGRFNSGKYNISKVVKRKPVLVGSDNYSSINWLINHPVEPVSRTENAWWYSEKDLSDPSYDDQTIFIWETNGRITEAEARAFAKLIWDAFADSINKYLKPMYTVYKKELQRDVARRELHTQQLNYKGLRKHNITIENIETKPTKTGKTYLLVSAVTDEGYKVCWNEFFHKDLKVGDRWNIGASIYMPASSKNPYNRLDKVFVNEKL